MIARQLADKLVAKGALFENFAIKVLAIAVGCNARKLCSALWRRTVLPNLSWATYFMARLANLGGKSFLPGSQVTAVESVACLCRGKPRVLPDGPGLTEGHGRIGAAEIGGRPRADAYKFED